MTNGESVVKRSIFLIITFLSIFCHSIFAQNFTNQNNGIDISIKYYNKTVYYPESSEENPIYVHITIANNGTEPFRFKLADDRMFSIDFNAFNVKNKSLPQQQNLISKRTTSQTVYFREISIESGEEYSFIENLKDYVVIEDTGIYYFDLKFYPELYKNKLNFIKSNRLTLDVRPSPDIAVAMLPTNVTNSAVLTPEPISPDKVIEQTIIARQRELWDQFFLYMDVEQMFTRDAARDRKYRTASADERTRMLANYKADLMLSKIDNDIVSIPERFSIERTTYSQTEGTVTVIQWFKYDTFTEKKRYEYFLRQRDGIWLIYDYRVENLGSE